MSASFDPYYEWLGIPSSEQPPDHYRLLGIELFENDPDVIAAAADRQIAFVVGLQRGDRAGMAQRLLHELSTARGCLLHPATRAEYEAALKSRLPAGAVSDQRIARPAPRSPASLPMGSQPPAGAAPSPPASSPPAPGMAGPPTGSWVGPAPGYAAPPGPPVPRAARAAPPMGPPSSPPLSEPPVSSSAVAPVISVTKTPGIATRTSAPSTADDEDATRNRQLWLLAAIVVVALLGTALTVAVITMGRASKPSDNGDGRPPAMESMSGPLVVQQADGGLYFSAADAVIHGDTPRRSLAAGREVITHWTSSSDWLSWDFRVEQPRMFRVELIYAAPAGYGGTFSVAIDDMKREAAVRNTGGADEFPPHEVGFLTVRRSGRYRFDMRVVQKPAGPLMILRAIRLTPYEIGHVR